MKFLRRMIKNVINLYLSRSPLLFWKALTIQCVIYYVGKRAKSNQLYSFSS